MTAKKNATKSTGRTKKTAAPQTKATANDEGRTDRRVPIQLLVDYKSDGNYLFDFCKDLGTGGVFIQTNKPLPSGSAIDLTFTIPDSKETLITKGTVIWVQDVVPTRKDLVPGMGVQFRGFSGDQRRLLVFFVRVYQGGGMAAPTSSGKRAG
jgi:uncharacterized protein (TIGR02266 family)